MDFLVYYRVSSLLRNPHHNTYYTQHFTFRQWIHDHLVIARAPQFWGVFTCVTHCELHFFWFQSRGFGLWSNPSSSYCDVAVWSSKKVCLIMASKSSLLRFRCRRSVGRLIGSLNQQTSSGLVKPLSLVELQNGSASSSQTEWLRAASYT